MPGGDRTGPMGLGQMTGRQAGYCAGYSDAGAASIIPRGGRRGGCGRGLGRGRGYGLPAGRQGSGRGWAQQNYGDMTVQQETTMLKNQAQVLKQQLDNVQGQITDLEKKTDNSKRTDA